MDSYLDYLKARIDKIDTNKVTERGYAKAEYNRALDFARRNGLTER